MRTPLDLMVNLQLLRIFEAAARSNQEPRLPQLGETICMHTFDYCRELVTAGQNRLAMQLFRLGYRLTHVGDNWLEVDMDDKPAPRNFWQVGHAEPEPIVGEYGNEEVLEALLENGILNSRDNWSHLDDEIVKAAEALLILSEGERARQAYDQLPADSPYRINVRTDEPHAAIPRSP